MRGRFLTSFRMTWGRFFIVVLRGRLSIARSFRLSDFEPISRRDTPSGVPKRQKRREGGDALPYGNTRADRDVTDGVHTVRFWTVLPGWPQKNKGRRFFTAPRFRMTNRASSCHFAAAKNLLPIGHRHAEEENILYRYTRRVSAWRNRAGFVITNVEFTMSFDRFLQKGGLCFVNIPDF